MKLSAVEEGRRGAALKVREYIPADERGGLVDRFRPVAQPPRYQQLPARPFPLVGTRGRQAVDDFTNCYEAARDGDATVLRRAAQQLFDVPSPGISVPDLMEGIRVEVG